MRLAPRLCAPVHGVDLAEVAPQGAPGPQLDPPDLPRICLHGYFFSFFSKFYLLIICSHRFCGLVGHLGQRGVARSFPPLLWICFLNLISFQIYLLFCGHGYLLWKPQLSN